MSIMFDRLRANKIIEPIEESRVYTVKRDNEGDWCLFKNYDEYVANMMGRYATYYPNGVLLTLKDKHKRFPDEQSYEFFNNDGVSVYNFSNVGTVRGVTNEPTSKVSLKVQEGLLWIERESLVDDRREEFFVTVKDGHKITDVFEKRLDDDMIP